MLILVLGPYQICSPDSGIKLEVTGLQTDHVPFPDMAGAQGQKEDL